MLPTKPYARKRPKSVTRLRSDGNQTWTRGTVIWLPDLGEETEDPFDLHSFLHDAAFRDHLSALLDEVEDPDDIDATEEADGPACWRSWLN